MSEVKTQGQSIIVDTPNDKGLDILQLSADSALSGWVVGKVDRWEEFRNRGYSRKWKEYWRMWRGQWHAEDKTRLSERSKLIAPALSQAIESSAAEVETILLDKSNWIDLSDDMFDTENNDILASRKALLEDLASVKAKDVIREAVLNTAIFGTGIIKLNVIIGKEETLEQTSAGLKQRSKDKVYVVPESIRPDEFIPDPSAKELNEMLGCAFRIVKPMNYVLEKIAEGEYRKEALAGLAPAAKARTGAEVDHGIDPVATLNIADADPVTITEYQGKVPANLLTPYVGGKQTPLDDLLGDGADDGAVLVEAIVTLANDSVVLKAQPNPFTMKDRGFCVTPWEKVPGRFWGRGVGEKGWNPQKALDAELRSRQDSLGYISAPMIGVDAGRLPKGFRMAVKPGKVWPTNGSPRDIIQPIEMGALQAATFNQTQEMERMVQMGTGAFDTAQALKGGQTQSGANSAGSNSAMMGSFVKRAKRAAATIESNLIEPMVRKSLYRYMQFDGRRYPADFKFKVNGAMGIMAREVESMQLTQLLGMLPQEVAPRSAMALAKSIVELSSVSNKSELNTIIDEEMAPPSEEEKKQQEELKQLSFAATKAQAQAALLENQFTMAKIRKTLNEALVQARKADVEERKQDGEEARILLALEELNESRTANELDSRRLDLEERRVVVEEKKPIKAPSS